VKVYLAFKKKLQQVRPRYLNFLGGEEQVVPVKIAGNGMLKASEAAPVPDSVTSDAGTGGVDPPVEYLPFNFRRAG
jgi:hypothetical protein